MQLAHATPETPLAGLVGVFDGFSMEASLDEGIRSRSSALLPNQPLMPVGAVIESSRIRARADGQLKNQNMMAWSTKHLPETMLKRSGQTMTPELE